GPRRLPPSPGLPLTSPAPTARSRPGSRPRPSAPRRRSRPAAASRTRPGAAARDRGPSRPPTGGSCSDPPGPAEHVARLGHGGRAPADVLRHLTRLGDEVAVGPRHRAVGEGEAVLEDGAHAAL